MGTYVIPHFRKRGLGLAQWREMLRLRRVRAMRVKVATLDGAFLLNALQRKFPNVQWKVETACSRDQSVAG